MYNIVLVEFAVKLVVRDRQRQRLEYQMVWAIYITLWKHLYDDFVCLHFCSLLFLM